MSSMTNATPESRTGNCWTDGKPDTKYPTVPPLGKPVRVLQTKHTLVNIVKSYGRVQQSNDKDKI